MPANQLSFRVEIRVTPREGIVDPEGQTIARALEDLGYRGVSRVGSGRLLKLELQAPSGEDVRDLVTRMCEELIANPVIERYEIQLEPVAPVAPGAPLEPGAPAEPVPPAGPVAPAEPTEPAKP